MRTISGTFTWDSDAQGRSQDRDEDRTRRPDRAPVPFRVVQEPRTPKPSRSQHRPVYVRAVDCNGGQGELR